MEVSKNTLQNTANYFKKELREFYDSSELEQILQVVFSHYLSLSRIEVALNRNQKLSNKDWNKIIGVVNELKQYKPLAQIIGEWEFFGLPLKINEYTLIPRPETEELVQLIIEKNKNPLSILDIGTGSGCIALALKNELNNTEVYACDVSKEALIVATKNAKDNNLEVMFQELDILNYSHQNKKYSIIVSNPPYITHKEKELMYENVLDYEPHLALFVADDAPLVFYNAIADFAMHHLSENGKLYFEINEAYGNEVKALLTDKKFKNINIVKDINEKDRIVSCTKN